MTTQQAIESVRFRLGETRGMETKIELDEKDVHMLIEMAMTELVAKVDTPSALILPYSEIIDVSKYHIAAIDFITRAETPYAVSDGVSLDPFYLSNSVMVGSTTAGANVNSVLQMQAAYAIRAMAQNTVQAELNYFHDLYKQQLIVSYAGSRPAYITILYRPDIKTVEDLPSSVWTTYLIRLATAHGKVIIGRIRAKYSPQGSPFTVNSEILQEGLTELEKLYEELAPLASSGVV